IGVLAFRLPPIPQPASYHQFADQRAWLGIPNFGEVASNLAFAVVGLAGLWFLVKPGKLTNAFVDPRERRPYLVAFFGLLLIVFGWYALAKIFETADRFIFTHTHIVSGHTVKHLAAASAGYWVLRMLRLREPISPEFIAH